MVIVALCFWNKQLCLIQILNNKNTLIVQSILQNMLQGIATIPSSPSSMPNLLLWSGLYAIISTCDPMQNQGQIRIFYKSGQTCLTPTKRDLVDPDNTDYPTWFQPWCTYTWDNKSVLLHYHNHTYNWIDLYKV